MRLLGTIRAGFASPAEEDAVDLISLDDYLVRDKEASYLLKVEGDSMEGAGILSGDLVIIERTNAYKPGDIVAALLEDGYTLKYLRRNTRGYYLQAANSAYPDIYPPQGSIVGVAVACVRTYR